MQLYMGRLLRVPSSRHFLPFPFCVLLLFSFLTKLNNLLILSWSNNFLSWYICWRFHVEVSVEELIFPGQEYEDAGTVKQNYVNILLMLLRLRQACDHPLLVKGCDSNSSQKSSMETAKKLPRDKKIVLLSCLEVSLAICTICNVSNLSCLFRNLSKLFSVFHHSDLGFLFVVNCGHTLVN